MSVSLKLPILMPYRTSERQEMPLVGGFGCLELVLYDMRELAQQHYEPLILLQSEIISLLLFSPLLTSNILAPAGGQQRGDISRRSVTWRI